MCSGWQSLHCQCMLALNFFDYEIVSSLQSDAVLVAYTILSLTAMNTSYSLLMAVLKEEVNILLHVKGTISLRCEISFIF